jgi:hypothetical protein
MGWSSRARSIAAAAGLLAACGAAAAAEDVANVSVSATVDKTSVEFGNPLQLTLTITGDLTGVQLVPVEFPEKFLVAGRSQATNVSIRGGVQERAMSLTYVLIPHVAGTFQLGPFTFTKGRQTFSTEPIEITVTKPAVPPSLRRTPRERFSL